MVDKEKIMDFVRRKGPILPVQLCKELGESTFIVGALLSELIKSGRLKFSTVKVGGSPLYYVDEQKHKLQNYSDYLNEKDKEAYEVLKNKVVVNDRDLTPLLRVSMRKINDFAFPVRVSINNSEELFWRWYLTPVSEVEKILNRRFNKNSTSPAENSRESVSKNETNTADFQKTPESDYNKNQAAETYKPTDTNYQHNLHQNNYHHNISSQDKTGAKSGEESAIEFSEKNNQQTLRDDTNNNNNNNNSIKDHEENDKQRAAKQQENQFSSGSSSSSSNSKKPETSNFQKMIDDFFNEKNITVKSIKQIKKNKEYEYIIKIPSAIGELEYFCRGKDKKSINENDIANAFVAGQTKKRPVLFITTGKITKKAENSLPKEFPGLMFHILRTNN